MSVRQGSSWEGGRGKKGGKGKAEGMSGQGATYVGLSRKWTCGWVAGEAGTRPGSMVCLPLQPQSEVVAAHMLPCASSAGPFTGMGNESALTWGTRSLESYTPRRATGRPGAGACTFAFCGTPFYVRNVTILASEGDEWLRRALPREVMHP